MKKLGLLLLLAWGFILAVVFFNLFKSLSHAQGPPNSAGQKAYIATAATSIVKPTSGFVHAVTINGGTAGVVSLYDIAAAGCAGTPASGKFATIETIGATNPVTLFYDVTVSNGLCVVTAQATDLTISFN